MTRIKYIKTSELASKFGVTAVTVNKWADKYGWKRVSFGGTYYINTRDVARYVTEHSF